MKKKIIWFFSRQINEKDKNKKESLSSSDPMIPDDKVVMKQMDVRVEKLDEKALKQMIDKGTARETTVSFFHAGYLPFYNSPN